MPQKRMPQLPASTESEIKTSHALHAFGPTGEVMAQSWDGGKTWKQVGEVTHPAQPKRQFTRKVMALIDEPTPRIAHRILTPFSVLDRANVLTGWAPYEALLQLSEHSIDGIVIPGLLDPIKLLELKKIGRSLLLDIDAPLTWSKDEQEQLRAMLPHVDGVLVPNAAIASKIRPYHTHVFVIQHLLRQGLWAGYVPRRHPIVQIGMPTELEPNVQYAVDLLREKHGERAQWTSFDWRTLDPLNEVVQYREFDIVILPPLPDRVQASYAPYLGAHAACCSVVGDRYWPGLTHRQTGITIVKPDAKTWIMELNGLIHDSSGRARIGRASRSQAMRMTAESKQGQVALPYRLLIPESEPVQIQE